MKKETYEIQIQKINFNEKFYNSLFFLHINKYFVAYS